MTETQPPLTVRIDRLKVIAARKRERVIVIVGGTLEILVAVAVVSATFWIISNTSVVDLFTIVFMGALALVSLIFGLGLLSGLWRKGPDYWNAEGMPEVAFVVHVDGVTISNPETKSTFEVPWSKLKAFEVKSLHTRFVFEPGVVEKKYRDQFWFGRATLDQDAATIRRALHALSGRAY